MKNLPNYYFCIDGGGTNSRARLYDSNENILSSSKTDSGNIYNDVYKVTKNINFLWKKCCKKAKLNSNKICKNTISSFGLAGARSVKDNNFIKKKFNYFKKIIISTDGYIALISVTNGKTGAILNIGTGVVANIMLKNKLSQQISGWGYPYGDVGGGWWIGFKSILETLKKIDGYNYDKDIIYDKVLKKIGNKDVKIISWLSNSNPKKIGELANMIYNIKNHSKIANKIITDGKKEIEKIIDYILIEKKIKNIHCIGGLATSYAPLLKKRYSKYLIYNKIDPLIGALLISKNKCPIEKLTNDTKVYK